MLVSKIFNLKKNERRIFFEAAWTTLWVRIITTVFHIKHYTRWLGQSRLETDITTPSPHEKEQIIQVKAAIARCRHLVWSRKCLVESIAAKRMLHRRNIQSTIYMGVAKNDRGRMIAHAWLRSGNIWVSGGRNRQKYTIVGCFS
ncbi:MAG: lasso peptide biosynthesis B2 protein [Bacteroidales bacterium]|jgi:hypothetical protein|nr:lasso peptide biosynthesis B2 protein [Bacteroidales bacterium]